MSLAPRTELPAAVLAALLLVGAPARSDADEPDIAVVLAADAATLQEPLLLALRLEFPDRSITVVEAGAPPAGRIAVVRVGRTATGLWVRVEETATRVAVERVIPVDASGDEPAAHAAALLARSLLGVALLYQAEARPAPAPAPAPTPPTARRPPGPSPPAEDVARAEHRRSRRSVRSPRAALLVMSATGIASWPLTADPGRWGGRLGLSARFGDLPFEAGLDVSLFASQDHALDGTTNASYEGIPGGAWLRFLAIRRPLELVPGVGVLLEGSSVVAGPRTFFDWNASLAAEVRGRLPLYGALHLEVGVRGQWGLGGQQYRWRGEQVFEVGGSAWGADLGFCALVL